MERLKNNKDFPTVNLFSMRLIDGKELANSNLNGKLLLFGYSQTYWMGTVKEYECFLGDAHCCEDYWFTLKDCVNIPHYLETIDFCPLRTFHYEEEASCDGQLFVYEPNNEIIEIYNKILNRIPI